jgi:thymidylate synthase
MKSFNIDRLNIEKLKLGENKIVLAKTTYPELEIKDGYLVDSEGYRVGTKGDMYTKVIMDKILQEGCLDHNPRPKYIDFYEGAKYLSKGHVLITKDNEKVELQKNIKAIVKGNGVEVRTPAHTLSVNEGIECTYDLSKGETPMITLRPIAIRSSVAEILWIYQLQSNDLVEFDELLNKNTWDKDHKINNWWEEWACRDKRGNYYLNEKGHPSIRYCYGGTTAPRNMIYREVIDQIKANQDGRRNITCLWQYEDFEKPHGLKPCAFLTIWNVRHEWDGKDYLDMTMVQRSSDFGTAGCINQVQYAALQKMVARELNLIPGFFTWKPVNIQIYDRHIDNAIEILNREPINAKCSIELKDEVKNFKDVTPDDIYIDDYPKELIKVKNPQLKFELGV